MNRLDVSRWSGYLARAMIAMIAAAGLAGCENNELAEVEPAPPAGPFVLQLLHAADMEAGAEAFDDAPRFSAVLQTLRAEMPGQTLTLSAGDNYLPGPFFGASEDDAVRDLLGDTGPGLGDIRILNAMGFQASALGNHEFDSGTGTVRSLLERRAFDDDGDEAIDRVYPGTAFPYLSANLDFSGDENLSDLVVDGIQPAGALSGRIAPSTVIAVNGDLVGIVGATTPALASLSSIGGIEVLPADETDLAALAAIIQAEVDALLASGRGIDKVIVLAHMQQIAIEKELAGLLRDVDIIVAGGSNTLLADADDRLRAGDTADDTYPLLLESATGEPVAVVNTEGNYRYVGRLVVEFDEAGLIKPDTIDSAVSGAYATDDEGVAAVGNPAPAPLVATIASALRDVIIARDGNTFGKTLVYLNGERGGVRTEETNLGNLSADSMLFAARQADSTVSVAIKNGGGIRAPIGQITYPAGSTDPEDVLRLPPPANSAAGKAEGQISQFDIENSLRFNNQLTLLTVTAAELKALVEHGVAAVAPGATPGQFPQVGGIRFSFDPTLEPGSRVQTLAVVDGTGNVDDVVVLDGAVQGVATRTFRVVTLTFLAGGGDGYPFPTGDAAARLDLTPTEVTQGDIMFADAGSEQHALAAYLFATYPDATPYDIEDVPAAMDERIQNLSVRADTVIPDVL